jgi:RNA ligase
MPEATLYLHDLVDTDELAKLVEAGYIRRQVHPAGGLTILNYTEKCQFERLWNDVTRQCRGLVVRDADGAVVARPWKKFFNYGDDTAGPIDLDAPAVVTDKIDGSLGILYPAPDGGHAIATRGSFGSDQAAHATEIWRSRYAGTDVGDDVTWLFEIVYPGNRIVCDYGDTDDLVLLGGLEISTGRPVPPGDLAWNGPVTSTFAFATLREALAAEPRPGAEGYVVGFPGRGDLMIKIKQEDYLALHRIVTGLNARTVWEALAGGGTVSDICESLPDEFHDWVRRIAGDLSARRDAVLSAARAEHDRIVAALPDQWTRRDYALAAAGSDHRAWLFMLLDGKDPIPRIWRTLRPAGDERPVNVSEDVA